MKTAKNEVVVKAGFHNILCTDGDTHAATLVGPGTGLSVRIYRNYKAAEKKASRLYKGRVVSLSNWQSERGE